MNRIAAIALLVGATLMTARSAAAQSGAFEVNVPFNFTVHNVLLPAGSYTIGFELMHPDTLVIRDRTQCVKATDFGLRGPIGARNRHSLIFHHYGGQYFLSEVRFESPSNGMFLPATKSERQARKVSRDEGLVSAVGAPPQAIAARN